MVDGTINLSSKLQSGFCFRYQISLNIVLKFSLTS